MPRLPSLRPSEMVAALQRAGLRVVREGKHTILSREGLSRVISVPRHDKEMRRNTMMQIIRQAGLTEEEFRKYLS